MLMTFKRLVFHYQKLETRTVWATIYKAFGQLAKKLLANWQKGSKVLSKNMPNLNLNLNSLYRDLRDFHF